MALHFGVSRSVVREAIALLKDDGILSMRKGSGAFVLQAAGEDEQTEQSVQSLQNLIEVRRGLETETAALAALRRTPGQLADIEHALHGIEAAVAAGVSGVEEDVRLHLSIAAATANPYWLKCVEMFAHPMRSAIKVTRANEARRTDCARPVRLGHERIVSATAAGDPQRVRQADRAAWRAIG
jgi:DNA-binding FadR family transcriptional regulator